MHLVIGAGEFLGRHVSRALAEDVAVIELDSDADDETLNDAVTGVEVVVFCAQTVVPGHRVRYRKKPPHLLEPALNDSTLRATTFHIVHGGWPVTAQTMELLGKPNVYTDISMMSLVAEPGALASALRMWLGEYPEKVMFGTGSSVSSRRMGTLLFDIIACKRRSASSWKRIICSGLPRH